MAKSSGLDLIRMQVMWNRLLAVVEEQAQVLLRTAFSPIVRECGDLSAGVFDLEGRMLAQAVTRHPRPCQLDGGVGASFHSLFSHRYHGGGRHIHHQ